MKQLTYKRTPSSGNIQAARPWGNGGAHDVKTGSNSMTRLSNLHRGNSNSQPKGLAITMA